ncbi:MAG: hypothetical protein E7083_05040 [Bacteroidales bacterium]|nr:hypothetical protein [Bacteroidales bacterium]
MENQNNVTTKKISDLMSVLLQQRITRTGFKINLPTEEVRILLTAAYRAEVASRNMKYQESEETNSAIKKMADALTTKSHKTGIVLCGTCGNGKTTLVRALQNSLIYLKLRNLAEYGLPIMDAREVANRMKESKTVPLLAIEDMGKEPTTKLDYGNILNPVIEVLEHRYNEQLFTVISTNLTAKEIKEKYGTRIADRFNEMMSVIIFTGKSFRR